jgi:hypothetical protein
MQEKVAAFYKFEEAVKFMYAAFYAFNMTFSINAAKTLKTVFHLIGGQPSFALLNAKASKK